MSGYNENFQNGKDDIALDLVNHFNKKIQKLKNTNKVSRNAHINALESFIKTIQKNIIKND